MTSIRKLFFLVVTLALTAFALPATAQKVYTINLATTPSTLAVGGVGQSVVATMNNISPDTGNSTIKSFKLFAPNGISITAPASGVLVPIGNGYTATIQNNGSSIYVSNINIPLKPFGTALALSMTVNLSCSATGGDWTVQGPWNGGTFTGQTFLMQSPSNLTTGVTGACTYSSGFLNQPRTTFAGYPITTTLYNNPPGDAIQVQLVLNGGAPPTGTAVTLTSPTGCSLAGNTASTNSSGVATFTSLNVTTAHDGCTLRVDYGTSNATSLAFDAKAPDGTLACSAAGAGSAPVVGTLNPLSGQAYTGAAGAGLVRGLNLDGTCGPQVPYTFSFDSSTRTMSFIEDSLGQHTSVEYVILWAPVAIDADGWAGKQPCVSWGKENPSFEVDTIYGCHGDFVPALFCLKNNVDAGASVMPTIPNVAPYTGSLLYPPGSQAKVCVAQQGVTSATDSSGNPIGVQYWDKLIDQADTFVKQP